MEALAVVRRGRDGRQLVESAATWIREAMDAWSDENFMKVAVMAPIAVEHLGKAVLWQKNPVLLTPLLENSEASLVNLATAPSLAEPKLRTIGLKPVLSRIEKINGTLPVRGERSTRLVDARNGAVHVAAATTSRHVLIDALTLCNVFLELLEKDPAEFYGDHQSNVKSLVEQGRSEIQHRVAAKIARAKKDLALLENRLGDDIFQELTDRLEAEAPHALEFVEGWTIDQECPVCGSLGRLGGALEMEPHIEYDYEPDVPVIETAYTAGWDIQMTPNEFACNVCRLTLSGIQELAGAGLPSSAFEIDDPDALGPDFDPDLEAERLYGIND
ncbi:hypothetical protein ACIBQ0_22525 [Nocardia nova]|uniref:hypothetical protein n=1 Tax=Nocardia nova TaxID=37330 RepID=UPI0037AD537B